MPFSTVGVVDIGAEVGTSGLKAGLTGVGDDGNDAGGGAVGGMTETDAGAITGGCEELAGGGAVGDGPGGDASSRSLMCFSATARLGAVGASLRNRR